MRRLAIFCLLLFSLTGCEKGPRVEWEKFSESALTESAQQGKPVIVYFYAAWCGPCHHLKDKTFTDQRVIEALTPFRRLKADMSFRESKQTIELSERYGVDGLPLLLFFDSKGQEMRSFRTGGYVPAEILLPIIAQAVSEEA